MTSFSFLPKALRSSGSNRQSDNGAPPPAMASAVPMPPVAAASIQMPQQAANVAMPYPIHHDPNYYPTYADAMPMPGRMAAAVPLPPPQPMFHDIPESISPPPMAAAVPMPPPMAAAVPMPPLQPPGSLRSSRPSWAAAAPMPPQPKDLHMATAVSMPPSTPGMASAIPTLPFPPPAPMAAAIQVPFEMAAAVSVPNDDHIPSPDLRPFISADTAALPHGENTSLRKVNTNFSGSSLGIPRKTPTFPISAEGGEPQVKRSRASRMVNRLSRLMQLPSTNEKSNESSRGFEDLDGKFGEFQISQHQVDRNPNQATDIDPSNLCKTCQNFDLIQLFTSTTVRTSCSPEEYLPLGRCKDICSRKKCSFCSLLERVIRMECNRKSEEVKSNRTAENEQSRDLWSIYLEKEYYLAPFKYPSPHGQGYELFLLSCEELKQITNGDMSRPEKSMGLRLILDGPRGGKLVPLTQIDFAWVRRTLELCLYNSPLPTASFTHPLRVIDVKGMCITDLPPQGRYLTLSYVWGGVWPFRLTRETETSLRKAQGLVPIMPHLSQTIRDAMNLVSKLQERYLWVDSLCIIQDDDHDKLEQIMQMEQVYGGSLLTISAVIGTDANYGLAGVRTNSRQAKQVHVTADNLFMSNVLYTPETEGALNTRGWAYQEKVLSQRNLLIHDNLVYFHCAHVFCPEDEHCWHPRIGEPTSQSGEMLFFFGEHENIERPIKQKTNFDVYAFMVSEYTQRVLTFPSDIGRAFLGIERKLESFFRDSFVYGLPGTEFDAALLWMPIGRTKRREDLGPGMSSFPSWSWQGWEGHAAYPWAIEREYSISTEDSPLEWKSAVPGGREFTMDRYRTPKFGASYESRSCRLVDDEWSSCKDLSANDGVVYFHPVERNRDPALRFVAPNSLRLTLQTPTVHFEVGGGAIRRKSPYNVVHDVFHLPVLDKFGKMAGFIYIPDPELQRGGIEDYTGWHEFIVLSRSTIKGHKFEKKNASGWTGNNPIRNFRGTNNLVDEKGYFDVYSYDPALPWCMYNVMMISREGRVANRIAIGRVHIQAVHQAEPVNRTVFLE